MEAKNLTDLVHFSAEGPGRETLFETERVWAELVSLERTQETGPMGDPGSDAIITVVAGEAVVFLDRERKRLPQWGSVVVPAGSEVFVRNASTDPAVILLVAAPPPQRAGG